MILDALHQRATARNARIALPDATDARTIQAALQLQAKGLCVPVLVGVKRDILSVANSSQLDIGSLEIADSTAFLSPTAELLLLRRGAKGMCKAEAELLAANPLYTAGFMLHAGLVDACVAGSTSTTPDVIRAAIYTVGNANDTKTISSFFLMVHPNGHTYTFADCGVVPEPTVDQLVDIAYHAALNHELLTQEKPRVAFLSFSTKGSARHPSVQKMIDAHKIFSERYPQISSDGELQIDAAIIPQVATRKAPNSPLAGNANVLIFPDLNSGNIAYKLTERLGGATALGPIVQGLAKPYCDLSRGCSANDIVNVAVIASQLAISN